MELVRVDSGNTLSNKNCTSGSPNDLESYQEFPFTKKTKEQQTNKKIDSGEDRVRRSIG